MIRCDCCLTKNDPTFVTPAKAGACERFSFLLTQRSQALRSLVSPA
jgi:hypothetical protein